MDDDEIDYGISVLLQENRDLKSELADAKARLAGYEVGYDPKVKLPEEGYDPKVKLPEEGYDPKVKLPEEGQEVVVAVRHQHGTLYWLFTFTDGWFESPDEAYVPDEIFRWFPLPGAAFGELAKGAE